MIILELVVAKKHCVFKADSISISEENGIKTEGLRLYVVVDGKEETYYENENLGENNPLDKMALRATVSGYLSDDENYSFGYVHPAIESFKKDKCEVFTVINGKKIYKDFFEIWGGGMVRFHLMFVTNIHAFYATDIHLPTKDGKRIAPYTTSEDIIVLYVSNGAVCATAEFAFFAFEDAMKDIKDGRETALQNRYTDEEWKDLLQRA